MATRRMNEMWRRLALPLVLSVLLLQDCQGDQPTTSQLPQEKNMQSTDPTGATATPTSLTISRITDATQTGTGSSANTAPSIVMETTNSANILNANVNPTAHSAAADNTVNDSNSVTTLSRLSISSSGNKVFTASPFKTEVDTKIPDQSTRSVNTEKVTVNSNNNMIEVTAAREKIADAVFVKVNAENVTMNGNNNLKSVNDKVDDQKNLGQTSNNETENKTSSSVFVAVLMSGLALGAVFIGVYVWRNHCHTKGNSMKLAEESDHADEENQGNTLVSVAPLNPPEDQEKPNQNGESLEAVKIQNPPAATNGHSATKADTEF